MSQPPDLPALIDDDSNDEIDNQARFRKRRRKALRVLFYAMLFVAAGLCLYAFWPWLMPAFIHEGPMVQKTGAREASLVWYMSRPVDETLSVTIEQGARSFAVTTRGRRCLAKLSDLTPGQSYDYEILLGDRGLTYNKIRTAKTADQPFSFLVFGDSGRATQEQYILAARMAEHNVDFILHTGDLVYGKGERRHFYERLFKPYEKMLARTCFWPCVGNHDVQEPVDQAPYFKVFELPENGPPGVAPEHDYWFDCGAARIAVIDSEHDEATLGEHVAPWLREVLSETDALWKFVSFHRPPYTGGRHNPCERIQRTLTSVFDDVGVDLVFNGHDHMYERTRPIRNGLPADDGPIYIVTGAGGAMLYDPAPPDERPRPEYIAVLSNELHSFTEIKVSGPVLSLEQIAIDGSILDTLALEKAVAAAP